MQVDGGPCSGLCTLEGGKKWKAQKKKEEEKKNSAHADGDPNSQLVYALRFARPTIDASRYCSAHISVIVQKWNGWLNGCKHIGISKNIGFEDITVSTGPITVQT